MSRSRLPVLALLALLSACADTTMTPFAAPGEGNKAISDAVHGEENNPFFFWLPPMVGQPSSALLGEPEMQASPRIVVVCQASNQLATCDGETPVESALGLEADFTVGTGLEVGWDMFQVDFDTRAFGLSASSADGTTSYTTYRIVAYTDPLTEVCGPFVLGYADFQVGENGKEAKSLASGEMIGLVDGRTLPIKFRIDKGAYAYVLEDNLAVADGDPADEPLCQENCIVAFVTTDDTTTVTLKDEDTGQDATGVQFKPGDVEMMSLLVIDERTIEGPDANCANGVTLRKKHCYRYRIFPDEEFQDSVRFGICPWDDVPLDPASLWRILKVDYGAGGEPFVTRPPEVDVSDFLPCEGLGASLMSRLFHYALERVVRPLYAQTTKRPWGARAGDFSDVFWALDAVMTPASTTDTTMTAGDTFEPTVLVQALYPEPDVPLEDAEVTFAITAGDGWLSVPIGADTVGDPVVVGGRVLAVTLLTDAAGLAHVEWTVGEGTNTLEVTSPDALIDTVMPGPEPIVFSAEGRALLNIDTIDPATVQVPSIDEDYGTFVMEGTGFQEGSVTTDAPSLTMLGDATVNVDGTNISQYYQIGTGAVPGTYWVYVTTPLAADSIAIEVTPPATTGVITGTVTVDGVPVSGATVLLVEAGTTITTDAGGGYSFSSVAPGTYTVQAADPATTATGSTSVTVVAGTTVTADLDIQTTGSITGTVTLDGSGPLALGTVTLVGTTQGVLTNASGVYWFTPLAPGTYTVQVVLAGYNTASATVAVTAGATTTADLVLFPARGPAFGEDYSPWAPDPGETRRVVLVPMTP
ncbi:MAG: carboxypeptidase regulatory-like domain-containing protein [Gemmatimonadota bacterium]